MLHNNSLNKGVRIFVATAVDVWEKSNFFGSIGSQKCTKNPIFPQGGAFKAPLASCRVNTVNTE